MSFNFITTNTNLANAYSVWPYLIFMATTQVSSLSKTTYLKKVQKE